MGGKDRNPTEGNWAFSHEDLGHWDEHNRVITQQKPKFLYGPPCVIPVLGQHGLNFTEGPRHQADLYVKFTKMFTAHGKATWGGCSLFLSELPQEERVLAFDSGRRDRTRDIRRCNSKSFQKWRPCAFVLTFEKKFCYFWFTKWVRKYQRFSLQRFISKLTPASLRCAIFDTLKSAGDTTRVSWQVPHLLGPRNAESGGLAVLTPAVAPRGSFSCFLKKFWNHRDVEV